MRGMRFALHKEEMKINILKQSRKRELTGGIGSGDWPWSQHDSQCFPCQGETIHFLVGILRILGLFKEHHGAL